MSAHSLPSWNDGATKSAILDFVALVTKEGGPDYVPSAERIAVFDNDGTLWTEQPAPPQMLFAMDRIKAMAGDHPEWKTTQPYQAVIEDDLATVIAGGGKVLVQLLADTHTGMTTDALRALVVDWIAKAKHPKYNRPFTQTVYRPMLELLGCLRDNGFKTFIVSGGGVEFMRPWAEATYGVPPEQVIGSSGAVKFEIGAGGKPVLTKEPKVEFVDDGPGKPVGINRFIGRRPIAAFGNSDGDLQMLQYTAAGDGARLMLYVHHDDAAREVAYDRQPGIGTLDKGLDEATAKGWVIASMKNDWKAVF